MLNIRELLDRYTRFTSPDSAVRKALAQSIKEEAGIDVSERSISLINNVAYVNIDTSIKSALFMRQEGIIKKTNERLGRVVVVGMR